MSDAEMSQLRDSAKQTPDGNRPEPDALSIEEPLGLKNPLLSAKPLGLNQQFLVPLGAQSLSVLDASIFQGNGIQRDFLDSPFQDSPFFPEVSLTSTLLPPKIEEHQQENLQPQQNSIQRKSTNLSPSFSPQISPQVLSQTSSPRQTQVENAIAPVDESIQPSKQQVEDGIAPVHESIQPESGQAELSISTSSTSQVVSSDQLLQREAIQVERSRPSPPPIHVEIEQSGSVQRSSLPPENQPFTSTPAIRLPQNLISTKPIENPSEELLQSQQSFSQSSELAPTNELQQVDTQAETQVDTQPSFAEEIHRTESQSIIQSSRSSDSITPTSNSASSTSSSEFLTSLESSTLESNQDFSVPQITINHIDIQETGVTQPPQNELLQRSQIPEPFTAEPTSTESISTQPTSTETASIKPAIAQVATETHPQKIQSQSVQPELKTDELNLPQKSEVDNSSTILTSNDAISASVRQAVTSQPLIQQQADQTLKVPETRFTSPSIAVEPATTKPTILESSIPPSRFVPPSQKESPFLSDSTSLNIDSPIQNLDFTQTNPVLQASDLEQAIPINEDAPSQTVQNAYETLVEPELTTQIAIENSQQEPVSDLSQQSASNAISSSLPINSPPTTQFQLKHNESSIQQTSISTSAQPQKIGESLSSFTSAVTGTETPEISLEPTTIPTVEKSIISSEVPTIQAFADRAISPTVEPQSTEPTTIPTIEQSVISSEVPTIQAVTDRAIVPIENSQSTETTPAPTIEQSSVFNEVPTVQTFADSTISSIENSQSTEPTTIPTVEQSVISSEVPTIQAFTDRAIAPQENFQLIENVEVIQPSTESTSHDNLESFVTQGNINIEGELLIEAISTSSIVNSVQPISTEISLPSLPQQVEPALNVQRRLEKGDADADAMETAVDIQSTATSRSPEVVESNSPLATNINLQASPQDTFSASLASSSIDSQLSLNSLDQTTSPISSSPNETLAESTGKPTLETTREDVLQRQSEFSSSNDLSLSQSSIIADPLASETEKPFSSEGLDKTSLNAKEPIASLTSEVAQNVNSFISRASDISTESINAPIISSDNPAETQPESLQLKSLTDPTIALEKDFQTGDSSEGSNESRIEPPTLQTQAKILIASDPNLVQAFQLDSPDTATPPEEVVAHSAAVTEAIEVGDSFVDSETNRVESQDSTEPGSEQSSSGDISLLQMSESDRHQTTLDNDIAHPASDFIQQNINSPNTQLNSFEITSASFGTATTLQPALDDSKSTSSDFKKATETRETTSPISPTSDYLEPVSLNPSEVTTPPVSKDSSGTTSVDQEQSFIDINESSLSVDPVSSQAPLDQANISEANVTSTSPIQRFPITQGDRLQTSNFVDSIGSQPEISSTQPREGIQQPIQRSPDPLEVEQVETEPIIDQATILDNLAIASSIQPQLIQTSASELEALQSDSLGVELMPSATIAPIERAVNQSTEPQPNLESSIYQVLDPKQDRAIQADSVNLSQSINNTESNTTLIQAELDPQLSTQQTMAESIDIQLAQVAINSEMPSVEPVPIQTKLISDQTVVPVEPAAVAAKLEYSPASLNSESTTGNQSLISPIINSSLLDQTTSFFDQPDLTEAPSSESSLTQSISNPSSDSHIQRQSNYDNVSHETIARSLERETIEINSHYEDIQRSLDEPAIAPIIDQPTAATQLSNIIEAPTPDQHNIIESPTSVSFLSQPDMLESALKSEIDPQIQQQSYNDTISRADEIQSAPSTTIALNSIEVQRSLDESTLSEPTIAEISTNLDKDTFSTAEPIIQRSLKPPNIELDNAVTPLDNSVAQPIQAKAIPPLPQVLQSLTVLQSLAQPHPVDEIGSTQIQAKPIQALGATDLPSVSAIALPNTSDAIPTLQASTLPQPIKSPKITSLSSDSLPIREAIQKPPKKTAPPWSTIADLVQGQTIPTRRTSAKPSSSPQTASQKKSSLKTIDTTIQAKLAQASPPVRVTRDQASSTIRRNGDDFQTEQHLDDTDYLETLAQAIYDRLRQRMRVEQERYGHDYRGRLPW
jgi:hypothetical protein